MAATHKRPHNQPNGPARGAAATHISPTALHASVMRSAVTPAVASHPAPQKPAPPAAPPEDEIRRRAYHKWQAAGCPSGDGVQFWLEAERELRPVL